MQLKLTKRHFSYIIVPFLLLVFFMPCRAAEETSIKVLLLPFEIRSEKDLAFLQKGMEEMLSKRLSENKSVQVVTLTESRLSGTPDPGNRKGMLKTASGLSADYLLTGSLTVFGNSISTEAEFTDTKTGKVLLSFSEISKKRDDVFEHLKLLADRISKEVLHPLPDGQKSIKKEPDPVKSEKILPPEKEKRGPDLSWKSRYFQTRINALSFGNVDGEEGEDIIFSSENRVFIYKHSNKKLVKFREIETPSRTRIIHVDAADINKNGKDEIFVTAISLMNKAPEAFILEWDGKEFQKNTENEEWYFSVLKMPAGKDILLGQKQGIKHPFVSGVHELAWENDKIVPTRNCQVPDTINIYEFSYGDLLADGKQELIVLDNRDRLILFHPNGERLWSGSGKYGGSETYLEYPTEYTDGRDDLAEYYYLQQRVHVIPCRKENTRCLLVPKNKDRTGRLFARIRSFKSGYVECLAWNGISMEEKWRTPDVSGYISDSAVWDLDHDGKKELVFSVVMDEGVFSKKKKSFIGAWDTEN